MYLIRLVVILRVVLKDFLLLGVVEVPHQITELDLFPPFLSVNEPIHNSLANVMYRSEQVTYIFSAKATSNLRARRNRSYTAGVSQRPENGT